MFKGLLFCVVCMCVVAMGELIMNSKTTGGD
jgi:hypothetical protein